MLNRRHLLLGLGATALAGCASNVPLIDPVVAETLRFRTITMDMSEFKGIQGRNLNLSNTQVGTDVGRALQDQLLPTPDGNSELLVYVRSLTLVSAGQSLLIGGASTITGTVQITNVETGELTLEQTEVGATSSASYAPGGLLGVVTTKSPAEDYRVTVASFAESVRLRLFGAET